MGEEIELEKFKEKLQKDFVEFQQYLNRVTDSLITNDIEKEVGKSTKTLVFENEIMELYKYRGKRQIPILIVNPLINGFYVLDLLPEISFIQFLVKAGYSPYIIKWKNLEEYKKEYDFDYYIQNGLVVSIDKVYAKEKKQIIIIGHCLGGVIVSSYLGAFNDERVKKYISMNSPFDFSKMGVLNRLTSKELVNIDKLVDAYGNIPAEYMTFSFQFINPDTRFKGLMSIFFFYYNKEFVRIYKALIKWRDDNINMPGEFGRTLIKSFFQENLLFNEKFKVFGKKSSLKKIKVPVLNIMSYMDDVAPYASCEALKEKLPDAQTISMPDGHLAIVTLSLLGLSPQIYWDKILKWIQE